MVRLMRKGGEAWGGAAGEIDGEEEAAAQGLEGISFDSEFFVFFARKLQLPPTQIFSGKLPPTRNNSNISGKAPAHPETTHIFSGKLPPIAKVRKFPARSVVSSRGVLVLHWRPFSRFAPA